MLKIVFYTRIYVSLFICYAKSIVLDLNLRIFCIFRCGIQRIIRVVLDRLSGQLQNAHFAGSGMHR